MNDSANPKAILQKICCEKDPKHWAPAFTSILLNHPSDPELAEYAKNLIFHKMLREGSESNLSSMISYPISVDWLKGPEFLESKYHKKALVHLPANRIFGSTNPVRECFTQALGDWLGKNFNLSKDLERTKDYIEKYINPFAKCNNPSNENVHPINKAPKTQLKVAMLPYHDTLIIPMLLEAVNQYTKKFTIGFDLHYFPDVSDKLEDKSLDIKFLSESRRRHMLNGTFRELRKENTEMVLLWHKKSEGVGDISHFYNYQGYYVNQAVALDEGSQKQISPINTKNIPKFYEREIDVLLALAAGLFSKEVAVVPSIQGYLWSKDTGLHCVDNLGGTLCDHRHNPPTSNKNGSDKFGIMAIGNTHEANNLAGHLQTMAEELHDKFKERLREGAPKEKAAALLLTPILTQYPKYSGLLTNISSELLTRMLEVESDYTEYQPDWLCNQESRSKAESK